MKVDGELPKLQLVISSMQIKHLVDLGKSLGEDFGGGEAAAAAAESDGPAGGIASRSD